MAKKRTRRTKEQIEADKVKAYNPRLHDAETILQDRLESDKYINELKESQGLGDTLEKVFKATGVDKIAKFILGEDCGCDKRKDKLNELFPYNKPLCLTEDEYKWLTDFFNSEGMKRNPQVITQSQRDPLLTIDARLFRRRKQNMSCVGCWIDLIERLRKIYNTYEI